MYMTVEFATGTKDQCSSLGKNVTVLNADFPDKQALSFNFLFCTKWVLELIPLFSYIYNYGGARGVMVLVIGNGYGNTSSNHGWDWLHFT